MVSAVPAGMLVRGARNRVLEWRGRPAGLLVLALLAAAVTCACGAEQPATLDSIIPTFSSELDILGRQVRSVLEASVQSAQAGARRYEAAMEEIAYEDDAGAQKAYETVMQSMSLRKDDLLLNGCSAADVLEHAQQKWTLFRLQKLHTLCVRACVRACGVCARARVRAWVHLSARRVCASIRMHRQPRVVILFMALIHSFLQNNM